MSGEVLVKVEGVSKRFSRSLKRSLWYGLQDLSSEMFGQAHSGSSVPLSGADPTLRRDEFWAVNDVTFELRRGECLGLIGHNGAGKTTLLKMLNGLIKPDHGRIEMRGKVSAMIALGAGFNPILTGRENIYVNATVLGWSKDEIENKIEEIIDFAGIGDFIDTPVQSYSSGMQVRLGFSVAVSMQPDILLVDEVLAVGDLNFKRKAQAAIYEIVKNSAVIFVSHSMLQVGKMCTRGILMQGGKISYDSNCITDVIDGYFEASSPRGLCKVEGPGGLDLLSCKIVSESPGSSISRTIEPGNSDRDFSIVSNCSLNLELSLLSDRYVGPFFITVNVDNSEMSGVLQCASINSGDVFDFARGESQVVCLSIACLPLNKGNYDVSVEILECSDDGSQMGKMLRIYKSLLSLHVKSGRIVYGSNPVQILSEWATYASAKYTPRN